MQYSFRNDYSEACHPNIIRALENSNELQFDTYGEDNICDEAKKIIRQKIKFPDADIHFLSGGTQTNLVMLAHALKPYESVIANSEAHICTHEAGAIEATGHKINTVIRKDGKLSPKDIQVIRDAHYFEHMVSPKLVFISNTTELGSVYQKNELAELSAYCRTNDLLLYLDGARLGSALTSKNNDMELSDIATYCDAFYIGGTKNGFLFGEALVITKPELKSHMRYQLKQRGALLAKGHIFGIQFKTMLENDMYFDLARHSNDMADMLAKGISDAGYSFLLPPESNQIFPIFPNALIDILQKQFGFYIWEKINEQYSCIRLVCSWKTDKKQVQHFISLLDSAKSS
jgi:threonine aldolase